MTFKQWLKFIEIQSLVASALPLILGNLYAVKTYHLIHPTYAIVFALVAFALQMAVNVWNNLSDFQRATSDEWKNGVNNIIGEAGITPVQGWGTLFGLVAFVAIGGIWLVTVTGLPLLFMGIIGFVIAYWYAGTPVPLSRTPFGELASGLTMGYLIFLAATYVNIAPTFNFTLLWHAIFASAVAWFAIGNIMLANNLGDFEEDVAEGRHTLAFYLGKATTLKLFGWIYDAGYVMVIISVLLGILPWTALIAILSYPIVHRNVRKFQANPAKNPNFILAIKNAVVISIFLAIGLGLGLIF